MKISRSAIVVIAIAVLVSGGIYAAVLKKINNMSVFTVPQQIVKNQEKIVDKKNNAEKENVDEAEKKKIMANNVTGTISQINADKLSIKTDSGQKDFNLTENSFVYAVTSKVVSKKLTDLKVGMKIYLQFDGDTQNALSITLQ
jgi:hypothetical protein